MKLNNYVQLTRKFLQFEKGDILKLQRQATAPVANGDDTDIPRVYVMRGGYGYKKEIESEIVAELPHIFAPYDVIDNNLIAVAEKLNCTAAELYRWHDFFCDQFYGSNCDKKASFEALLINYKPNE